MPYAEAFIGSLSSLGKPYLMNFLFSWPQQHLRLLAVLWLIKIPNLSLLPPPVPTDELPVCRQLIRLFVVVVFSSKCMRWHFEQFNFIQTQIPLLTKSFSSFCTIFWFSCVLMMSLKFVLSVNLIITFLLLVPRLLLLYSRCSSLSYTSNVCWALSIKSVIISLLSFYSFLL